MVMLIHLPYRPDTIFVVSMAAVMLVCRCRDVSVPMLRMWLICRTSNSDMATTAYRRANVFYSVASSILK